MKGLSYDALLNLTKEGIEEAFPFGANAVGEDKWAPAEEGQCDRTLERLLRDKKRHDREADPIRLLAKSGPRYDPSKEDLAGDDRDHGYTSEPYQAMRPDAGEAVAEADQAKITENAHARYEVTHAEGLRRATMRSRLTQLRQMGIEHINAGGDPVPEIEQALEALRKKRAA